MDLFSMIIFLVLLFFVIYGAVHYAIQPIIDLKNIDKVDVNVLHKVKGKGLISTGDFELFQDMTRSDEEFQIIKSEYIHVKRMYGMLRDSSRISNDEYLDKIQKLEDYYNIK